MDDDSKIQSLVKWGLGALGLGAVAAAITIPKVGIWIAVLILFMALVLFGGYYLWHRSRARRRREQFTSAIEAQTAAAPKAISDPNKRAALDKVRQKFETGLQEFKSRGKDIYKLPWYVIIGESGSGKTEAIRHSGIEFPPGLQDELQGSGGTVNMDWWFTNRGIILDTAGSMIFNEARAGETPEWREFLRLLKKARPQCPINGLFLVLSVESCIRDSADKIAQKASVLAQQLDMIQRTLDVRFPVYLVVTKCDLLTGFREFFDFIDDPLLQHQMFGWSNPNPLDSPFRPDMVDQHLKTIAERVRRRRLALLREASSGGGRLGETQHFFASSIQLGRGPAPSRRLDEVDSMFAFPESLMRLAPRLRRYLETVFVAGEWSAKPVFLRGIYFTSSMREGKALDEAIAFATGLSLDQLPEDRSWEKNRAFFLRDLFHEKVFRESGLVTRATNTLALLRQRQLAIFGTVAAALLLLLVFAGFAYHNLKNSVLEEAGYWQAGADNWKGDEWSPAIISPGQIGSTVFVYGATNPVSGTDKTLIQYHQKLKEIVGRPLAAGLFRPMVWIGLGSARNRREAQRFLFEGSVIRPLVKQTRFKIMQDAPPPGNPDAVNQQRDALLALMQLEADAKINGPRGGPIARTNATQKCERYLKSFFSYLMPGSSEADTNLVALFAWTYSAEGWPPASLQFAGGGDHLSNNVPIEKGLENFRAANRLAQGAISNEVQAVNRLVDALEVYGDAERNWLLGPNPSCPLPQPVELSKRSVDECWNQVSEARTYDRGPLSSLAARYRKLREAATSASAGAFTNIATDLTGEEKSTGIFGEISRKIQDFNREAGAVVNANYEDRGRKLDASYVAPPTNCGTASYQLRWSLYTNACELATRPVKPEDSDIGNQWMRYDNLRLSADTLRSNLSFYCAAYNPFAENVSKVCDRIAGVAEKRLKEEFVDGYVKLATQNIEALSDWDNWSPANLKRTTNLVAGVERDSKSAAEKLGPQAQKLKPIADALLAVAGHVQDKLGFPVLLKADSGKPMTVAEMVELKNLLGQLTGALQNPAWTSLLAGDALKQAGDQLDKFKHYYVVAGAFIGENSKPTKVSYFFFPPEQDTKDWRAIREHLPYAVFSIPVQTKTNLGNLTRLAQPVLFAEANIDAGGTIEFFQSVDASDPVATWNRDNWLLPRLIREGAADWDDKSKQWRLRLKLQQGDQLEQVLRAVPERDLPGAEDWPRP